MQHVLGMKKAARKLLHQTILDLFAVVVAPTVIKSTAILTDAFHVFKIFVGPCGARRQLIFVFLAVFLRPLLYGNMDFNVIWTYHGYLLILSIKIPPCHSESGISNYFSVLFGTNCIP